MDYKTAALNWSMVLFALLALAGTAHAQWVNDMAFAVSSAWGSGSWQILSATALFLAFFIVIIAYMASIILGSKELRMWAKSELLQVMASAVLVLGLIAITSSLLAGASILAANVAGDVPLTTLQKENPFALAHYYLDMQIGCAKGYYRKMFWLDMPLEPMEKLVMPTGGMEEITGWVFSGIVGTIYWITHQITFLLLADYFQRHLLIFIEDNAFTVLLPVGIVLRILPYTRGAGGVIIAIAMGLFLVYPLMYAIFLGLIPQISCGAIAPTLVYYEATDPTAVSLMTTYASEQQNLTSMMNFLNNVDADLKVLFIFSFVAPIVNLTVTLTFIRAAMQFLGADVAEMGEGLIKII